MLVCLKLGTSAQYVRLSDVGLKNASVSMRLGMSDSVRLVQFNPSNNVQNS